MPYHVPVSAIPLLQDPPFVLYLTLLAAAIGYRVLSLLRVPMGQVSALERGTLSAAVGFGLLQYLPFALGMAGSLSPLSVRIGLIGLTALVLPDMLRILRGMGRAMFRGQKNRPNATVRIGIAAMAALLFLMLFPTLCPPTGNDDLGYHLTAPKRWLQAGDLHYLPTLLHTQAPMGVEMLFTLALAVWSDTAAKLIHYTLGVLALLAIYGTGRRLKSAEVGFCAAALFLANIPGLATIPLFVAAYIDLGITFQFVCAVLAWLLWRRGGGKGWLLCSALCAGFAATSKQTGILYGLGIGLIVAVELRQRGVSLKEAVRKGTLYAVAAFLPVLPWLYRTWRVTGNPIYPMLPNLFPSRDWNAEGANTFRSYMTYYNWGRASALIGNWSVAERQAVLLLCAVFVLALTAALLRYGKDIEARALTLLAGVLLAVALLTTGLYLRLMAPVFPLIYLLVFLWLSPLLARTRWIPLLVILMVVDRTVGFVAQMGSDRNLTFLTAAGLRSREKFIERNALTIPLWNYVNAHVPADQTVLVAGFLPAYDITGGLSYYSERPCIVTDGFLQRRIRMDSWPNYLSDIQREGIRYVIVPEVIGFKRAMPDSVAIKNEFPFARRLVAEYGERLLLANHMELYRLRPLDAVPAPSKTE
jgi:hypothetical protein